MDIAQVETAVINRSEVVIARGHLAGYKGRVSGYGFAYDMLRIYLTDDNGDIFDKVSVHRSSVDLAVTETEVAAEPAREEVELTTEPVHVIAHRINTRIAAQRRNRLGKVTAFVQPCGTLRIAARTCSAAEIVITEAVKSLGLKEATCGIDRFQVRFTRTGEVLTYPLGYQLNTKGLCPRTGAFL